MGTQCPPEKLPKTTSPVRVLICESITVNSLQQKYRQIDFAGVFVQAIPDLKQQILKAPSSTARFHKRDQRGDLPNCELHFHFVLIACVTNTQTPSIFVKKLRAERRNFSERMSQPRNATGPRRPQPMWTIHWERNNANLL